MKTRTQADAGTAPVAQSIDDTPLAVPATIEADGEFCWITSRVPASPAAMDEQGSQAGISSGAPAVEVPS